MRRKKALITLMFTTGCAGQVVAPVIPEPAEQSDVIEETDPVDLPEPEQVPATETLAAPAPPATPVTVEPEEPEESISTPLTTRDLCEPIGERRGRPTDEQRKETRALVTKTCKAMGVGTSDCKYFRDIISIRESNYRPWVRHKLSGDVAAALRSYLTSAHRYGWAVRWNAKDRKNEDLSKLEFFPYGPEQNQWFQQPERWMFGLGLGGINISYHLGKFDPMAPPEILCDPVINVMVQITSARNAVRKYGAKNYVEIQAVYGGRTYRNKNGKARAITCINGCPSGITPRKKAAALRGDKGITGRCRDKGLNCMKRPNLGTNYILKSMTREERYEAAEAIRGKPLPEFDFPQTGNMED
jgi:hypothetical protein